MAEQLEEQMKGTKSAERAIRREQIAAQLLSGYVASRTARDGANLTGTITSTDRDAITWVLNLADALMAHSK